MDLRDRILQEKNLRTETVEVPEWGETIEIRELNGFQRAALIERVGDKRGSSFDIFREMAELVVHTAFDPEKGEPVFQPDDTDELLQKSGAVIERLAKISSDLSGITRDAAVGTEKNSASGTRSDASTSE